MGEVDVGAGREGNRTDPGRFRTDVYADVAEVGAERRFHLLADRRGRRLAAAARQAHHLRRDRYRLLSGRLGDAGRDQTRTGPEAALEDPRHVDAWLHRRSVRANDNEVGNLVGTGGFEPPIS